VFVVGKSKKKAKHSAAESLLNVVEGMHVDAAALYVVSWLFVAVFVAIAVVFLSHLYILVDLSCEQLRTSLMCS